MAPRTILPAVSVALIRGERVLLVLRGRAPSRGLYAFPGGRVEAGETLEAAARRELMEETGLSAQALTPVARFQIESEVADYDLHVFSGPYAGGQAVAGDDAQAAGFYTLAEMEAMPVTPSVTEVARDLLGSGKAAESGENAGGSPQCPPCG